MGVDQGVRRQKPCACCGTRICKKETERREKNSETSLNRLYLGGRAGGTGHKKPPIGNHVWVGGVTKGVP